MDVGSDNFRFTLDDPEKKSRAFRYPMSSELHISSLDRYPSVGNYSQSFVQLSTAVPQTLTPLTSATNNCQIQTNRSLLYGYFNRVAITEMQLSLRMPTIIAGVNDEFITGLTNNSLFTSRVASLTIPPGYYTPVELAAQMQVILRSYWTAYATNGAAITVTAPTNGTTASAATVNQTGFVIATNTIDKIVLISPLDPVFAVSGLTDARKQATLRFYRIIGAVPSNFTVIGGPYLTAFVATTGIPNFLPTDYVDIVSKRLTNYKETKDTNSNQQAPLGVIGRIYLTDTYRMTSVANSFQDPNSIGGAAMTFTKKWAIPNWSQWSPNQAIDSIDITLLDMWGNPIPWDPVTGATTEWEMTILASE